MNKHDPDFEIAQVFSRRDCQRAAVAQERAEKNKRRSAWLALLKSAAVELGSLTGLMVMVGKCCEEALISPTIAAPTGLVLLATIVWRACLYWQALSE